MAVILYSTDLSLVHLTNQKGKNGSSDIEIVDNINHNHYLGLQSNGHNLYLIILTLVAAPFVYYLPSRIRLDGPSSQSEG